MKLDGRNNKTAWRLFDDLERPTPFGIVVIALFVLIVFGMLAAVAIEYYLRIKFLLSH